MLNNFFIIFLILISFTKIALSNEPTDIWSLEKEEKSSEENITIDNVNGYLDLQGNNITIDGKGYTITVEVANYPGFIKNGDNSTNAPCKNCTIKNIGDW